MLKKTERLVAQSYERAHEVISAINTLSIHTKLVHAGVDDASRRGDVAKATTVLVAFLDRLATVVTDSEHHRAGTVLGADPRLAQLARKFLAMKGQWPRPEALYSVSFDELRQLLAYERREDMPRLIGYLRDLRALVEQHAHADIVGMLGEL